MSSAAGTKLLDRLEIILEALSDMPETSHSEAELSRVLQSSGHRPPSGAELRALAALGRDFSAQPPAAS
ncbi:MAG: hypothetical protein LBH68_02555 [Bifidobacteriaceae bacterium]|nr:hypothetical protein [Bifidobacteriaceae bacterium]